MRRERTIEQIQITASDMKTEAILGQDLINFAENVREYKKRDCYIQMSEYLHSAPTDRVCILYGLWQTGKITMIKQAILDMNDDELSRTVYIKATEDNTMQDLNDDMKLLSNAGYKYVFVDEVTLIKDFINTASILSDVFAAMGMKIVLFGKDSLVFDFAKRDELYDRAKIIHTTHIPFGEYSKLCVVADIDGYIRYGGTLNITNTPFENTKSASRYVNKAISENIWNTYINSNNCNRYDNIRPVHNTEKLGDAIRYVFTTLNNSYINSILELDMDMNPSYTDDIVSHLSNMDVITETEIENIGIDCNDNTEIIFMQPGIRYANAKSFVELMMTHSEFADQSETEKETIANSVLDKVKEQILADIVLLETRNALDDRYKVFKLKFAAGEYDMVIYDKETNTCEIYEIKHSTQQADAQYKHLIDEEKCAATEKRFGKITNKIVIYRGEDLQTNGIEYRNVEEYLKMLYEQSFDIEQEQEQGFDINM